MRIYISIYFALLLFGCCLDLHAQQVNIRLQFNETSNLYEVHAIPDFDNDIYFVGGGSQISVLLPQDLADVALQINSVNGGVWTDNSKVFAPVDNHIYDFHGIATNGGMVNFEIANPLLLFTFELPEGICRSDVRLYENISDINDKAAGMNNSDFKNFFANVFEPFKNNYAINEHVLNTACAAAPVINSAALEVQQDKTGNICLPIEDLNEGDSFTVTIFEDVSSSLNGTSVASVTGNTMCLEYIPNAGYIGPDQVCVEVCDQTGLCNNAFVAINVVPEIIYSTLSATSGTCETNLNWTILQPAEFASFELERSLDGVNFTSIGAFESVNQTNDLQFTYTDEQVMEDYFYRLKLVFNNEEAQYSAIVFTTADCEDPTFYATIEAEANFCENRIQWNILSPSEVTGYELERSSDGIAFELLKAFQSSDINSYIDSETKGDHYYRLKLNTNDGTSIYTNNVFVNTNCEIKAGDFVLYPNPASQHTSVVTIKFFSESEKLNLILTDALGRVVRRLNVETNFGVNTIKLDISKLAPATYFVTLEGKEVMTKSFVKFLE